MKTVHFATLIFFIKTKAKLNQNYKAYAKFKSNNVLADEIALTCEAPMMLQLKRENSRK